jgi:hypothetical protein
VPVLTFGHLDTRSLCLAAVVVTCFFLAKNRPSGVRSPSGFDSESAEISWEDVVVKDVGLLRFPEAAGTA